MVGVLIVILMTVACLGLVFIVVLVAFVCVVCVWLFAVVVCFVYLVVTVWCDCLWLLMPAICWFDVPLSYKFCCSALGVVGFDYVWWLLMLLILV